MRIPIGEMREPVIVLTRVRTSDESGGEVITYTESDPIFVSIRGMSTNEAVQLGQVNAEITHVCFGHWESLNQLVSTDRIRHLESGQEYDIAGAPINDPKRSWSRLNLVSRENG